MIFAEALTSLDEYRQFTSAVDVPGAGEPDRVRQDAALHARGDARRRRAAGALSADRVPHDERGGGACVRRRCGSDGTQKDLLDAMQTREQLYEMLGYHEYEKKLDELFNKKS